MTPAPRPRPAHRPIHAVQSGEIGVVGEVHDLGDESKLHTAHIDHVALMWLTALLKVRRSMNSSPGSVLLQSGDSASLHPPFDVFLNVEQLILAGGAAHVLESRAAGGLARHRCRKE